MQEVKILAVIYQTFLFLVGGFGYVGLELLWRGRSHISMFLAGGLCFLLLGQLDRTRLSFSAKCLLGAVIITAVELLAGLLTNRDHQVWDYRQMPFNFLGQVCLSYSLLWIPVSFGAMLLHRLFAHKIRRAD
jgi:uncharacterized membrane protein